MAYAKPYIKWWLGRLCLIHWVLNVVQISWIYQRDWLHTHACKVCIDRFVFTCSANVKWISMFKFELSFSKLTFSLIRLHIWNASYINICHFDVCDNQSYLIRDFPNLFMHKVIKIKHLISTRLASKYSGHSSQVLLHKDTVHSKKRSMMSGNLKALKYAYAEILPEFFCFFHPPINLVFTAHPRLQWHKGDYKCAWK